MSIPSREWPAETGDAAAIVGTARIKRPDKRRRSLHEAASTFALKNSTDQTGQTLPATARMMTREVKFVTSSPLEGDGFELPVPSRDSFQLRGRRLVRAAIRPQSPAYLYVGGGTKPPISAASRRANSIVVGSSFSGPMICRPTGSPSSVKPIGAAVAGRYDTLASPAKNNCSAYGADLPLTLTVRSSRLGSGLCGKAAVAATGVSNTSKRLKNSCQAYRSFVRASLALPQARCSNVAPRATAARS